MRHKPSERLSLLIFETHPIQYRAPVYRCLNQLRPNSIHVVYASDYSVRGGHDSGFGQGIAWDTDLLAGYPSTVLSHQLTHAPSHWHELGARGLSRIYQRLRPRAVLLNSVNYWFDIAAYGQALMRGIPVWMRCETQDYAFPRSPRKAAVRRLYYQFLYSGIRQAFPIGVLNRQHWLCHGLQSQQLQEAHYCTPNPCARLSPEQKQWRRQQLRQTLDVMPNQLLVSFFGKFVPKKDPLLLFQALPNLSQSLRQRLALAFVGSGELQKALQEQARHAERGYGIRTHFPGFVNQSALVDWYLASDVVVLPSRRAGETWGLVVNEALQAGCAVVISEAVGCSADFGTWERVRIIPEGGASALARALEELATYPRSFDWASEALQPYSIEAAAQTLAEAIDRLD